MIQDVINKIVNKYNFHTIIEMLSQYDIDINLIDKKFYPEITLSYSVEDNPHFISLEFGKFYYFIDGEIYYDAHNFFKNYKKIEKVETDDFIYTIKLDEYYHGDDDLMSDYFCIEYDVHNDKGYAIFDKEDKTGVYCIDGEMLPSDKCENFERELKLKRIL